VALAAIFLFTAGSAICASAPNMTALIAGRGICHPSVRSPRIDSVIAIQGVGGGGSQALVYIITADLIPLRERGLFTGITGWYHSRQLGLAYKFNISQYLDFGECDWPVHCWCSFSESDLALAILYAHCMPK
jgi:hypothetical protein